MFKHLVWEERLTLYTFIVLVCYLEKKTLSEADALLSSFVKPNVQYLEVKNQISMINV